MFSTVQLVNFMDYIPLWVVKLGDTVKFKIYDKLFITSVFIIFIYENVYGILSTEVNSIRVFVTVTLYLAAIPAALTGIQYIWIHNIGNNVNLLDLKSLENLRRTNGSTNSNDVLVFLLVLGHLSFSIINSLQYTMFYYGRSLLTLNAVYAWAICHHFQSQVIIVKYFNIQCFNVVIESLSRDGTDVLTMIPTIRKLMNNSRKTNNFFSQLAAVAYSYTFVDTVSVLANIWVQFGVKKGVFYQGNEFEAILGNGFYFLLILAVNVVCSLECSKVSDVQWKVDLAISSGQTEGVLRSQLIVFLQELHHYPLQLTGMDFFVISCSSLTSVCGLLINFLLVFVQFT